MSTFLDDVILRTLGDAPALQPRTPARFEPSPAAPALWIDPAPAQDAPPPGPHTQGSRQAAPAANRSRHSSQPLSPIPPLPPLPLLSPIPPAPELPGSQRRVQSPAQGETLLPATPAAQPMEAPAGRRPALAPDADRLLSLGPQPAGTPPSSTGREQQPRPQPGPQPGGTQLPSSIQPLPMTPTARQQRPGQPTPASAPPMPAPAISVRVHIGRIEMQQMPHTGASARPAPPRTEPQRTTAALRPAHSLDDYLGRKGRRR